MQPPTKDIDPIDVHARGLSDPGSLDPFEYAVFATSDFETYLLMEGWGGFFVNHLNRYHRMKERLAEAGDAESTALLGEFERFLSKHRVRLETYDLGQIRGEPDWGTRFMALADQRWRVIEAWLAENGRRLVRTGQGP